VNYWPFPVERAERSHSTAATTAAALFPRGSGSSSACRQRAMIICLPDGLLLSRGQRVSLSLSPLLTGLLVAHTSSARPNRYSETHPERARKSESAKWHTHVVSELGLQLCQSS
jgi:hypothetical protein